jgi:uncharacterized protein
MSRIFWDTNIFIYLFEGSTGFAAQAAQLREKMLARGDQLVTSTFSLGEILVKPARQKNSQLLQYYKQLLPATSVLIPFDEKAASAYAQLRCDLSLRHPDAIQLACAASYGVDLFITNDMRLQAKRVSGIQFIASLDRVPI